MEYQNNLDPQLLWVTQILNSINVEFWLDNGSLLGMIRDEKLMHHDRDIDISINENQIDNLLSNLEILNINSYRIVKCLYKKKIFKIKLIPKNKALRTIDFAIFTEAGPYFISPQPVGRDYTPIFGKIIARLFNKFRPFVKSYNAESFWIRSFCDLYTIRVPEKFFKKVVFNEKLGLNVPMYIEKYLEYKYKNWRLPVKGWNFKFDDGTIVPMAPEDVR